MVEKSSGWVKGPAVRQVDCAASGKSIGCPASQLRHTDQLRHERAGPDSGRSLSGEMASLRSRKRTSREKQSTRNPSQARKLLAWGRPRKMNDFFRRL